MSVEGMEAVALSHLPPVGTHVVVTRRDGMPVEGKFDQVVFADDTTILSIRIRETFYQRGPVPIRDLLTIVPWTNVAGIEYREETTDA